MTYTGRCRNLCLIIWYVFRRLSDTLGIDYQLQFKLLPLIATVYAFYAAGNFLINMYEDARSEIANKNNMSCIPLHTSLTCHPVEYEHLHSMEITFVMLVLLHATSSGLKSFLV